MSDLHPPYQRPLHRRVLSRGRHVCGRTVAWTRSTTRFGLARGLLGDAGVLMYHRVANAGIDPWELSVSPENFDAQLGALAGLGDVLPLQDLARVPATARITDRRRRFAITFDDGYVDNLRVAVPLLERHGLPATFFIATGFLDTDAYWWDIFDELVLGRGLEPCQYLDAAAAVGIIDHPDHGAPVSTDMGALHRFLYESVVNRPPAEIRALLDALADELDVEPPTPDGRPMTTAELLELVDHPLITLGGHTMHHPRLGSRPLSDALVEIESGRRRLQELTGRLPTLFAYPYGDYDDEVAELTKAVGFEYAVTTDEGWVGLKEDRVRLPRLHVKDVGGDELWASLARRGLRPK